MSEYAICDRHDARFEEAEGCPNRTDEWPGAGCVRDWRPLVDEDSIPYYEAEE